MDPIMGTIILFAGNFAPQGWFTCEGQSLPVNQYQALFSLLGNRYGGDAVNTFNLPDLRGAFPTQCSNISSAHPGGTYALAQVGGAQNATITAANLPAHTHAITGTGGVTLKASSQLGVNTTPAANNVLAQASDSGNGPSAIYNAQTPDVILGGITFNASGMTLSPAYTGGPSSQLPIIPPFVAMQYIINVDGVYPTRP
jgi:microcystin-dependent protein